MNSIDSLKIDYFALQIEIQFFCFVSLVYKI